MNWWLRQQNFSEMSDKEIRREFRKIADLLYDGKITNEEELQKLLNIGAEDLRRSLEKYSSTHPFKRDLEQDYQRLLKARDGTINDKIAFCQESACLCVEDHPEVFGGNTLEESKLLQAKAVQAYLNLADKLEKQKGG